MVVTANAAVGKSWAGLASGILTGLLAGAVFLYGALDWASSSHTYPSGVDAGIMVTAVAAAALSAKPVRERLAAILPVDPDNPVHSLALVLAVILLGTQIAAVAFTDVLAADQQQAPLSIGDLIGQEAPFLILAFIGVGLYSRRGFLASLDRLGLTAPAWWQIALALGAAGAFYALSVEASVLGQQLNPALTQQVEKTSNHLFGALGALDNPAGIVALAVAPGLCEEILFRGALQPRLGLVVTAVLFAAIHTQYGFSIDVLTILVIAIGLGLIRKYTNTTTSVTCHITYNLLASIPLVPWAWPSAWLVAAIGAEVLLAAVVAFAIWSRRRPAEPIAPEVAENTAVR